MSGAQKAAALLIAMGRETAGRLLRHLDHDEVKEITRAAATLGIVDGGSLEALIAQFAAEFEEGPKIVGDIAQAEQLGTTSLAPEEVTSIIASLAGPPKADPWSELQRKSDSRIREIVASEPSQLAALILSRLDPGLAARVCSGMPDERRADVLSRVYGLRPITPCISNYLQEALLEVVTIETPAEQSAKPEVRVANIVNRMEPDEIDGILASLSKSRPEEASAIRMLIFKFDDIRNLSQAARAQLFDQIPTERVILALQGASEDLCELVVGCLGARARRMVEAELASGQQPPARDIAAARRLIADTALRLADSGAIELG